MPDRQFARREEKLKKSKNAPKLEYERYGKLI
jgi:hypothetical protein